MSKNLTKFVILVTIKFRMRNTLSQESLQITFVLTDERKISIIELGEGFAKFEPVHSLRIFSFPLQRERFPAKLYKSELMISPGTTLK